TTEFINPLCSGEPEPLQDTLLQREEELARLQEENIKLREFLSSSFVRSLQQKAKVGSPRPLNSAYGRKNLKRNLTEPSPLSKQISKRVCRNLTAEFCSESSETSVPSEPNLDLWVLQTLGLKDRDTIDTSAGSSPENNFPGAITSSSSSDQITPETFTATGLSRSYKPRGQKDLAFRMSLTQSSCVKTHSFPQGQAFVRRDGGGRWNFTWVPRQEP
uniref:Geminin coiled-coil domain containing n=1 Tax=Nothobranchius furzeri TaxID=105023 RepID=A0A8C6K852_NOTFU